MISWPISNTSGMQNGSTDICGSDSRNLIWSWPTSSVTCMTMLRGFYQYFGLHHYKPGSRAPLRRKLRSVKHRIREITLRAKGVSLEMTIAELASYMLGWRRIVSSISAVVA